MRKMKNVSVVLIIAIVVSLFSGCGRPEVPDLYGMTEGEAVKTLKEAGFVPIVEKEYREIEERGKVFKSSPTVTATAKKGSEVVIYISKGPEKIVAKNAGNKSIAKNLSFNLPYVDKGVLYIECFDVAFKDGITWEKSEDGISVTEASLTNDFEKTIPAKIKFEKEYAAPLEKQNFIIGIPLEELGEELPKSLSVRLNVKKDELPEGTVSELVPEDLALEKEGIKVIFSIEW